MDDADVVTPDEAVSSREPVTSNLSSSRSRGVQEVDAAESSTTEQGESRVQRNVPYAALAEERSRRKGLQRELQSAVEAQQKLQGRLDLLHELAQRHASPNTEERPALQEGASEVQGEPPPGQTIR